MKFSGFFSCSARLENAYVHFNVTDIQSSNVGIWLEDDPSVLPCSRKHLWGRIFELGSSSIKVCVWVLPVIILASLTGFCWIWLHFNYEKVISMVVGSSNFSFQDVPNTYVDFLANLFSVTLMLRIQFLRGLRWNLMPHLWYLNIPSTRRDVWKVYCAQEIFISSLERENLQAKQDKVPPLLVCKAVAKPARQSSHAKQISNHQLIVFTICKHKNICIAWLNCRSTFATDVKI